MAQAAEDSTSGPSQPPLELGKLRGAADKQRGKKVKKAPARERPPAKASPDHRRVKQPHGGALLVGGVRGNRGGGRPIRHGLYLSVQHSDLGQLIETYAKDPNALTIYAELAAARALFTDYVNRFTTWPPGDGEHERAMVSARELLSEITKIWKRIMDVRSAKAIGQRDLYRILAEMGRGVALHVQDEETRKRIRDHWAAIPMG